jgi:hypothetical protein
MAYGSAVLEKLLRRGVLPEDIETAGTAAWLHLIAMLPSEDEVAAAEDFSEAPKEGSTS